MSISIKNFVNANIEVLGKPSIFRGFTTTVYFANCTINVPDVAGGNFASVTSLTDFQGKVTASNAIQQSVEYYFSNGGTKLCVVSPSNFTLEGFKQDMVNVTSEIEDYFFVVLSDSVVAKSNTYPSNVVFSIADFCSGNGWTDNDKKSLNTMRACFTTNVTTFVTDNDLLDTLCVVKYSTLVNSGNLVDLALLVGAYFSQIDVTANDPILDYNFTTESVGGHYEDISQATFVTLNNTPSNGYYNFIGKVSNKILNIGGDYCSQDKISISLDFGAACIERDLNYANIELLFGKLPLNQVGQSKLIDAIRSQLVKYIDSGFLELDATYAGDTKQVVYNGRNYNVIKSGDVLPLGYKVFYVPITSISAQDRRSKRFPYIYVALQSVHGARVIQVNGGIL